MTFYTKSHQIVNNISQNLHNIHGVWWAYPDVHAI